MDGATELLDRLNDVVGWSHDHGGLRIMACDEGGPESDARGGIPAAGFANNALARQLGQLMSRFRDISGPRDDPGSFGRHLGLNAIARLLEETPSATEGEELFGPFLPAPRPEPRPATTRHNHCVKH
jgi:hypothetical protein